MNTLTRKLAMLAALGAATAGLAHAPQASAQTYVTTTITTAPPPVRYEAVPPPRPGWIWAPGYWRWDGYARRHVWVGGYWVRGRPGYRYVPGRWDHYGPGWRFRQGYWVR